MPKDPRPARPQPPRHAKKRPREKAAEAFRSPFAIFLYVLTVAAVSVVAYAGYQALQVRDELTQAKDIASAVRAQVEEGDIDGVEPAFNDILAHTNRAAEIAQGPAWELAERLPKLGQNFTTLRQLTGVANDTLLSVEPLMPVLHDVTSGALKPEDGRVSVDPFVTLADELPTVSAELDLRSSELAAVQAEGSVAQLQDAKTQLESLLTTASDALDQVAPLAQALPALLGADGKQTYVVYFASSAEPRSLGGSALSFVQIDIDEGDLTMTQAVPAGLEQFPVHLQPVISVPAGFDDIYDKALGRYVPNATIRPSQVTAAAVIKAEWQLKFGINVDSVVSVDGPTLQNLLAVTGPVTLSTGEVIDSSNVVDFLFNGVYQKYNTGDLVADDLQQNLVYSEVLAATFSRITSGQFEPLQLLRAVRSSAAAKGFSIWSDDLRTLDALDKLGLAAQDIRSGDGTNEYVGVYLNDQVGSKLGYYLDATAVATWGTCGPESTPVGRVDVSLANLVDPAEVDTLSPSITGIIYQDLGLPKAAQRYVVFVYMPQGATMISASVNGDPVPWSNNSDAGHPVQVLWIMMMPGETGTLSVDFVRSAGSQLPLMPDLTPTIRGSKIGSAPIDCSAVQLP